MLDPVDQGACTDLSDSTIIGNDTSGARRKTSLYLYRTLVSLKLSWIFAALDDVDYFNKDRLTANRYVSELMNTSLSCFRKLVDVQTHEDQKDGIQKQEFEIANKRKDILEVYARVALANYLGARQLATPPGDEAKRERLEKAVSALDLTLSLLDKLGERPTPKPDSLTIEPVTQSKIELRALKRQINTILSGAL